MKQQGKSRTRRMVLKDPCLFLHDCQVGITRDHLSMPDFEDKVTRSTKQSHMGSLADFLVDYQSQLELKDDVINHLHMEFEGSGEALQEHDDNDEFLLRGQHDKSNLVQDYVGDKFDSHGERIVEVELDPEPLVEEKETESLEGNGDSQFSTQSTNTGLVRPLFMDETLSYRPDDGKPNTKEDKGVIHPDILVM